MRRRKNGGGPAVGGDRIRALLPAALLALFSFWSGTFAGAAGPLAAAAGQLALLAFVAWGGGRPGAAVCCDPLGLGRHGRWLPPALWLLLIASWLASPVPRAGRTALLLLPADLLLPAAVARCWRRPAVRRRGLAAVALVVLAVAAWAIAAQLAGGGPRPALPLGHHNLLAAWLVIALPLALAAGGRLGIAAALAAAAVTLASRSLTGGLVLMVMALGWGFWRLRSRPRSRPLPGGPRSAARFRIAGPLAALAAIAALLALVQGDRLRALLQGDPSLTARLGYLEAGVEGIRAGRPLGWGPGSTAWTVGRFVDPVPGVNPPSEVVAQLHSLPLQLAYELGIGGLLLAVAIALLFVWRRLAESGIDGGDCAGGENREARRQGRLAVVALAAGGLLCLVEAWLSVPALPLLLAVAAGTALAAGADRGAEKLDGEAVRRSIAGRRARSGRWVPGRRVLLAYATIALLVLAPAGLAHWHYERARRIEPDRSAAAERRIAALRRAVALDPSFPLYRARLASLLSAGSPADDAVAEHALQAAAAAPGVAVFQLLAGFEAAAAAERGAPALALAGRRHLALARALDPLAAPAPFGLALADPDSPAAAACLARALLAEPALAASEALAARPRLLSAAAGELDRWPGIDPGWLEATAAAVRRAAGSDPGAGGGTDGDLGTWYYGFDRDDRSLSLHAFRRLPWPDPWLAVTVRAERVPRGPDGSLLPPAAALATSAASAFPPDRCAPPR